MKTFQISRVYHVLAESIEDARTQLRPANPACRIDFESIQAMPTIDEPSEVKRFAREAVRQLTGVTLGSTPKQEPRRNS